jgi:hypothetical protein
MGLKKGKYRVLDQAAKIFGYFKALVLFSVTPTLKFTTGKAKGIMLKQPSIFPLFRFFFSGKQALHMQMQCCIDFAVDFHSLLIFRSLGVSLEKIFSYSFG